MCAWQINSITDNEADGHYQSSSGWEEEHAGYLREQTWNGNLETININLMGPETPRDKIHIPRATGCTCH